MATKAAPPASSNNLKDLWSRMSTKVDAPSVPMEELSGAAAAGKKKKPTAIEEIYQKKSQLEHILLRPDTYIGSVEPISEKMWVFEDGKMVHKQINYVPGLYKIFDEILVNAADNKQRDKNMDTIKIDIDQDNNTIAIYNNGHGIPIVEHKEEKMYVPTMIFGHLLTSSNFNDEEKKVTGGRNGYGAKLCNVFSTKFTLETCTRKERKSFKQTWEHNMSKAHPHKIVDATGDDFTRVTFKPDLKKFNMEKLDDDIVALFKRRAYDVAGTSAGVKVFLDGKRLPVKNFKDYVDLFLKDLTDEADNPVKSVWEKVHDRWEIAICPSEDNFRQISFVNSIATTKGGRHVDYIADMVCKQLVENINKKNKGGIAVKPFQVRNHLWVFVNCLIENPTFDSQTKETMTLQARQFGSKCEPSPKFFAAIQKSGIIENVLSWAKFKQDQLKDKTGGKKTNKVKGIPKLEDANDAGTRFSLDCTLVLTEGDSAKSLAVAGLGVIGRDKYGVFPLRGKLLNVREASHKQIIENAEINAMVKILGLKYKQKYDSTDEMKTLRYGKLMIMTDQDHDGSHIKGLIINFIHHNWPSLLQRNFIEEFITPIVKVTKGDDVVSFYSMPELDDWKTNTPNWKTYRIKYYKGLGTSTSAEAKEYFTNIERHRIKFRYAGTTDDDTITMAFSKKCIEQRKDWLTNWMDSCKRRKELGLSQEIIYGQDVRAITYSEFVNKELVLFSNLDNERSIPCLVDGLKPGQRKVLFTCFKRNDKREVKVAQLAGSVAEHSAYHHGEASLMSTIINLAQNYVGSNNINLLEPNGQFGTRLQGGKDSASPRYIFTMLSPMARVIFNQLDSPLLRNLYDDNQRIEPEWYCPIIPMVLVNGADGIGTGWMTRVPNFNPREIVANLRRMIRGEEPEHMKPWYKNFRGEIIELTPHKYAVNGEVAILDQHTLEVTELPISTWTQSYKENVIEIMANGNDKTQPSLTGYKEYNTDTTVRFILDVKPEVFKNWEKEGFHRALKLQSTTSLSSMVLFDKNGCLKRYESPMHILREFFELRMHLYVKRREYLIGMLTAEALKLSNQARFIVEKCDGDLVVENKKKKVMIEELVTRKYDSDPVKAWQNRQKSLQEQEHDAELRQAEAEDEETRSGQAAEEEPEEGRDFEYLLQMRIMSLTFERKAALMKERDEKKRELEIIRAKTPANLYNDDLDVFMSMLDKVEDAEREEELKGTKKAKFAKQAAKRTGKGSGGKAGAGGKRLSIAHVDTLPSTGTERIQPVVDDLLKKEEAKKGKGERKPRAKKEKKEDLDEFDLMADDKDSLFDKIQSSTEGKKVPPAKKRAAGGSGGGAKKNGGGFKQTKLNFGKKETKVASPKAKKTTKEYDSTGSEEVSLESELFSSDDSSSFVKPKKPVNSKAEEAAPAAEQKLLRLESDDDEDQKASNLPATVLKKIFPSAAKVTLPKKKAPMNDGFSFTESEDSDSDSDRGKKAKKPAPKKTAPKAAAPRKRAEKPKPKTVTLDSDSDDDFKVAPKENGKGETVDLDSPASPTVVRGVKRATGARAKQAPKVYRINSDSDDNSEGFGVPDESSEDEYQPSPSKKRKV